MRGKYENFRLSPHVRLLPLTVDNKLGLTYYLKITDQSNRTYEFSLILTWKHDGGWIRILQILWSIALKLQIGKDDDKKESKDQKYIY